MRRMVLTACVIFGLYGGVAEAILIGHWALDENTGSTAVDSSGQGHNAVLTGAVLTTGGKAGGQLSLDGNNDYGTISGTETEHLQSGFTISAWVRQSQTFSELIVFAKHLGGSGNGWFLSTGSGYANFYVNGEEGRLHVALTSDNTWHQLVGTYDGTHERLYIDGNPVLSNTVSYVSTNTRPWMIGGALKSGGGYNSFNGSIDDVQLYNTALMAGDVQYLYSHPGLTIPEPTSIMALAFVPVMVGLIRKRNTLSRG